jgi:hypothetical protein
MGGEQAAILLVGVVHVLAVFVLIWMLVQSSEGAPGLGWWFGNDQGDEPEPPRDPVAPGGAALPLPVADPSPVRLRGPGRIADGHSRPERRPAHHPEPVRAPDHA